jgi:23S rRNA (guanosine2251-2'-O)-methyltransferase
MALPSPEALAPDEELVAGRRPVEEAFVARRPAIRLLVVPQRRAALEKLVLHATNLRIPIVEVEGGSLTALAGFDGHQGVALVVEPRQFASLDDVLARAAERDEPPLILVLDSLEDPHNVGTLLRSAEAAGVHGVLFPTHRQAPLSASAVKASAGAIEHLLLCPVDDLPGALSDLHARGVRVAGAEGDAPMTARQTDLRGPLAIVVGSEGQGLGPAVRRRCDLFMRIPMKGAVGSLNAAVAGSILLFEALAQREPNAMPSVVPPIADAADGSASRTKGRGARRSNDTLDARSAAISAAQTTDDGSASTEVAAQGPDAEPAAPKARTRKGLTTEPAEPPEPDAAEPASPKRRVRKGLSTELAEPAAVEPAEPAAQKPRPGKGRSTKSAEPAADSAPEPVVPTPRAPKAPSTKRTDASTEAAPSAPDDDLLPSDGAAKRSRKESGPA